MTAKCPPPQHGPSIRVSIRQASSKLVGNSPSDTLSRLVILVISAKLGVTLGLSIILTTRRVGDADVRERNAISLLPELETDHRVVKILGSPGLVR